MQLSFVLLFISLRLVDTYADYVSVTLSKSLRNPHPHHWAKLIYEKCMHIDDNIHPKRLAADILKEILQIVKKYFFLLVN